MQTQTILFPEPSENFLKSIRQIVQEEIQKLPKPQATNGTEFIKIIEVCEILKVSRPTIYDWEKRGFFHSYKINSRTFYNRQEILDYLQSHTR